MDVYSLLWTIFCGALYGHPLFGGKKKPFWPKNIKKVDSALKNGPIVKVYTSLEAYGRVLSFVDNFFLARFGPTTFWRQTPLFVQKMSRKLIARSKMKRK